MTRAEVSKILEGWARYKDQLGAGVVSVWQFKAALFAVSEIAADVERMRSAGITQEKLRRWGFTFSWIIPLEGGAEKEKPGAEKGKEAEKIEK